MAGWMRSPPRGAWWLGMLALWAGASAAQPAPEYAQENTGLPTRLQYQSPIGAYQAYADQPVGSWREANDRVGRIGGWKAYAREAQAAGSAAGEGEGVGVGAGENAGMGNTPDAERDKAAAPGHPHAGHHGGRQP